MNKTTAKDLRFFKERVQHWRRELGLMDWSIHVEHEALEDRFAETRMDNASRVARVVLGKDWNKDEVTKNQLNITAFHECCHLLLNDLINEAQARYAVEYDIDRAEHAIIRVLENLITGTKR